MKKFLIISLLTTLTITSLPIDAFATNITTTKENIKFKTDNFNHKEEDHKEVPVSPQTQTFINEVEPFVIKTKVGTLKFAENLPNKLREKYNLEAIELYFEKLNADVSQNKIQIEDDLSITILQEDEIKNSIKVSSDFRKHSRDKRNSFWWGVQIGYCTKCTSEASSALDYTGTITGGIIATIFPGLPGGLIDLIIGSWSGGLARDMRKMNNSKGIWVDLNLALFYNVYKQG